MSNGVLASMVLKKVRRLGSIGVRKLIDACGGPTRVFTQSDSVLKTLGVTAEQIRDIRDEANYADSCRAIDDAKKRGFQVLTPESEGYPEDLKRLEDCPTVLYAMGDLKKRERSLAIVGTRSPSIAGARQARRFARVLSEWGVSIVSGLARGIDTAAHEGALEGGGGTVAVLGSGLLEIYPRENRALCERIAKRGLVLSEFELREPPQPFHFPMRNRLISGMSKATLIVEAPRRSGSLITAEHAIEQGKDVFVIPGAIEKPQTEGSNELLKEGAACVTAPEDILGLMGWEVGGVKKMGEAAGKEVPGSDDPLLACLQNAPLSVAEVSAKAKMDLREVMARLSHLEAQGMVQRVRGHRYVLS